MIRYLLDTNFIIFALKNPGGKAATRLCQESPDDVFICSVVEAELYHGAEKYAVPERRRVALEGILNPYRSLPFDSSCVPEYARIRHELECAGMIIGGNDLMIAAIALTHDLTLVTSNSGEFARVSGLRVEDWSV